MRQSTDKTIVYIVSFFLFSGYYAVLSIFFNIGRSELSIYFTFPLRIFLSVIMVYYIIKNFKNIKSKKFNNIIFIMFSCWYIVKILYTANLSAITSLVWYEYLFYYLSFVFFPFFFFKVLDIKKYERFITNAFIFSGFLLGAISVFTFKQVFSSGGIGRISQLSENGGSAVISPLALAYSGSFTVLLCLYRLNSQKINKWTEKIYLITTLILSIIIFYFGATRGALIVLIVGVFALLYFSQKKKMAKMLIYFLVLSPVFIYLAQVTGSALVDRSIRATEGDTSGRNILWKEGFQEFLNNPFFGGRIEVSGIYPHNIFIEILMSMGIIGFVLFLVLFLNISISGIYIANKKNFNFLGILMLLTGTILHSFSGALWSSIILFSALGILNNNNKC